MLPSPSESYQAAVSWAYWVAHPRFGLGARRTPNPSGLPLAVRIQGRDSLDVPLLRFSSPARYCPIRSTRVLSTAGTSRGVSFPSAHEGQESPRPGFLGPGSAVGSHTIGYGAAQRVSHPLGDLLLYWPSRPFQTGGARGFRPSGVHSLHEASAVHRRGHALLAFLRRVVRSRRSFIAFRAFVFVKVDPHRRDVLSPCRPICPSWDSASSWFAPTKSGDRSLPSCFTPCI